MSIGTALCVFGPQIDIPVCLQRFDKHTIFHVPDEDIWKSFWLTANAKRQHELDRHVEFHVCLGVNSQHMSLLEILNMPHVHDKDVLYFYDGSYDGRTVGINPSLFLSASPIFDLVSNYHVGRTHIPTQNTVQQEFYFFIKQFSIRTQCINYENSNLFKWST